ncbi:MAG: hypothetical protein KAU50_09025 [Candidatus Marinimicrobia bacterium]|nr:hypothetical protein [Candidatus Neomarinimicrobiota bacterium]
MATASRLILASLLFAALACDSAPQEPEYDNPIIPDDPNYEPPQTTIILGPDNGAVLDTHSVTIGWDGNQGGMEFAYRLNSPIWSEWGPYGTTHYYYLDEGNYLFEVKGRYASGVEEDSPDSLHFTVDDIHGPALWLTPRYQEVTTGGTFVVEVMLEDVTDVMAVKAVLEFDPAALQVSQIEVYEDSRSLLKANGGTVIPFSSYDNVLGTATIEVATAIGDPSGVSGTGSLGIITFSSGDAGDYSITITPNSQLRNPDNGSITITEKVEAFVEVAQ